MSLNLRGPSQAALSATFAGLETQRAYYERGRQIDDCSSAAAWNKFILGSHTVAANATPDPVRGPYLTITSDAIGTNGRIMRDVGLDLTGKFISCWIRVKDANLTSFQSVAAHSGDAAAVTTTCGDSSVTSANYAPGTWFRWTHDNADSTSTGGSTPTSFADTRQFGFRLKGTASAATQVDIADIRVHDKGSFRGGYVVWQFDDAKSATYNTTYPILNAKGYRGCVPVEYDTINDGLHMTVAQMQELHAKGWAFNGHYSTDMSALSDSAAETILRASRGFLRSNGLMRGANYWVWPGGQTTANLDNIALRYFRQLRRVSGNGRGKATPWVQDQRMMPLLYCTSTVTPATIKAELDKVAARDGVIVLVFHDVLASGASGANYDQANFQQVVDYAASLGLKSTTYSELYGE